MEERLPNIRQLFPEYSQCSSSMHKVVTPHGVAHNVQKYVKNPQIIRHNYTVNHNEQVFTTKMVWRAIFVVK